MKARLYAEAALIVFGALAAVAAPFAVYPFAADDPAAVPLFVALVILALWAPMLAALGLAVVRADLRRAARR